VQAISSSDIVSYCGDFSRPFSDHVSHGQGKIDRHNIERARLERVEEETHAGRILQKEPKSVVEVD